MPAISVSCQRIHILCRAHVVYLFEATADLTPFQIFSQGVAGFLETFGVPNTIANVFMTMCVSALALTSLDSVARIGRMSFQELFASDETDKSKIPAWQKLCLNQYFATAVTLFFGYLLCLGGYANVWALFGSANQMLAALVLIGVAVYKETSCNKAEDNSLENITAA